MLFGRSGTVTNCSFLILAFGVFESNHEERFRCNVSLCCRLVVIVLRWWFQVPRRLFAHRHEDVDKNNDASVAAMSAFLCTFDKICAETRDKSIIIIIIIREIDIY